MERSKNGFTLAEVLITLGIIGVVAAMTIPTLMNNVQDAEMYSATRKFYSVISNATERMVYENSGIGWDDSGSDGTVLSKNMADAYAKYLNVVSEDFIENIHTKDWYTYKSSTIVSGTTGASSGGTRYALLLKDGMIVKFSGFQSCSGATPLLPNRCGGLCVDVNGNKPPNMLGRDTFVFWLAKDANGNYKVVPSGPDTDGTYSCSSTPTSTTTTSFGCTEYVINNQPLPQ